MFFHVFMLKKFVFDPSHILTQEPIEVHENLAYEEKKKKNYVITVDKEEKMLRNKVTPLVKVLWKNN